jgi:hypothetical protein
VLEAEEHDPPQLKIHSHAFGLQWYCSSCPYTNFSTYP